MLNPLSSDDRYVVVRLCIAGQIQYLGRVPTLAEFERYRACCGFGKTDIAYMDTKNDNRRS